MANTALTRMKSLQKDKDKYNLSRVDIAMKYT